MKTAKKNGKKFLEKMGELMDDHQEWGKADGGDSKGQTRTERWQRVNLYTQKKN